MSDLTCSGNVEPRERVFFSPTMKHSHHKLLSPWDALLAFLGTSVLPWDLVLGTYPLYPRCRQCGTQIDPLTWFVYISRMYLAVTFWGEPKSKNETLCPFRLTSILCSIEQCMSTKCYCYKTLAYWSWLFNRIHCRTLHPLPFLGQQLFAA